MEKSRSWPSAHDWKSCIPQKGIEGSNPSFSAIKENPVFVKNTGFLLPYLANVRLLSLKFEKTGIYTKKVFPLVFPYGFTECMNFSILAALSRFIWSVT